MIDTRSAQRIKVPNADALSGLNLIGASLHETSVTLTFENTDRVAFAETAFGNVATQYETVELPLNSALVQQLSTVSKQGRIEIVDESGRARRLFVSRQAAAALAQIHLDYTRRISAERATRAAKLTPSDVRIWGAGSVVLPNRRRVTALSGGVVGVQLRYETTVQLVSAVLGDQRLEFVLEFETQRLTAAWDSPAPEQVLKMWQAANEGRLYWSGVIGDDQRSPQLVKIDVVDPERVHVVLQAACGGLERLERRGVLI